MVAYFMKQPKSKLIVSKEERNSLKKLGRRIAELAAKRRASIEKIAYEGGVSKGYLYDIVRGNGNPSLVILLRIAEALEVKLTDLVS